MGCFNSKSRMDDVVVEAARPVGVRDISIVSVQREITQGQMAGLMDATYEGTNPLEIRNHKCWGRVIKTYDGDSCHIALFYKGEMIRISCRVAGIDTPEIRGKTDLEKEWAVNAREVWKELTNDILVWVHIDKPDKYGRYLVTFYTDDTEGQQLNQVMVDRGLACEYDGGTKMEFEEWFDITKAQK